MKSIDNYIKIFLTLIFCISAHGKTKFTDRQVAMMIPKYFARDHNAPKITRTRVYGENGKKILHLNIEVNRNSCLLYTSPSPRDAHESRMPSSA